MRITLLSAALAGALAASPSQAAIDLSLEFVDATGYVSPTQTIDVSLKLTVNPGSDPFNTVDNSKVDLLAQLNLLPEYGFDIDGRVVKYEEFGEITLWGASHCFKNTFTSNCQDSPLFEPYDVQYYVLPEFALQAGESQTFEFMRLTPTLRTIPEGDYQLKFEALEFQIAGYSEGAANNGFNPDLVMYQQLVQTCDADPFGCPGYSRTVTNDASLWSVTTVNSANPKTLPAFAVRSAFAYGPVNAEVPLPATVWLFGGALISLIGLRKT